MIRTRMLLGLILLAGCLRPNVAEERDLGHTLSQKVEENMGLYPTRARGWCAAVGERLVANLDAKDRDRWTFSFDVVDAEEPNAFALPGGPIYVSRGLLALVVTEDELAGILGHEITHVTERHSTAWARRAVLPTILTIPGRVVGVVIDESLGDLVNAPVRLLGGLELARYSREQETEADGKGSSLAAKAGYDPRALGTILARIEKDAMRITGEKRKESYFDDHPSTPTRIADLDRSASRLRWTSSPPRMRWPDILATLDGLAWGPNPGKGVFVGQRFLHPDLGIAVRFPEGWKTVNSASAAGATHDADAVIVLATASSGADPSEHGRAFAQRMRKKGMKVDEEKSLVVNENAAYVVRVSSTRSSSRGFSLWVRMGRATYQLVGLGPAADQEALWKAATSLRPITPEERGSITVMRLRTERAAGEETLARLIETSRVVWSPSYTALANGTEETAYLRPGALVKVAVRTPYEGTRPTPAHD
jgi:predicted Zn-dependent protease